MPDSGDGSQDFANGPHARQDQPPLSGRPNLVGGSIGNTNASVGQPNPATARPQHADADRLADEDLMLRVARGEQGAVDDLYDRFASLVYRMAFQALPSKSDAEDAVQEVFVRLWRTADRYDRTKSALVTWVMLITRRHLVDKLRRTKARVSAVALDPATPPADASQPTHGASALEQEERFGTLMKRIDTLPELQRTVVVRAYLGGQTLRQIGQELDTPLGTVKSALSRALVRLRERAGEEVTG